MAAGEAAKSERGFLLPSRSYLWEPKYSALGTRVHTRVLYPPTEARASGPLNDNQTPSTPPQRWGSLHRPYTLRRAQKYGPGPSPLPAPLKGLARLRPNWGLRGIWGIFPNFPVLAGRWSPLRLRWSRKSEEIGAGGRGGLRRRTMVHGDGAGPRGQPEAPPVMLRSELINEAIPRQG